VLTLIGTGRLGTDKVGGLKRSQQPIASPWDLCIVESPCKSVLITRGPRDVRVERHSICVDFDESINK
jgi:hypothetical protein